MRRLLLAAGGVTAVLGVRLARSRHRRSLHPDGRSFAGELAVLPRGDPGRGDKVYLSAGPDPDSRPLGATLESVGAAARHGTAILLYVDDYRTGRSLFGRITFGTVLPDAQDGPERRGRAVSQRAPRRRPWDPPYAMAPRSTDFGILATTV